MTGRPRRQNRHLKVLLRDCFYYLEHFMNGACDCEGITCAQCEANRLKQAIKERLDK